MSKTSMGLNEAAACLGTAFAAWDDESAQAYLSLPPGDISLNTDEELASLAAVLDATRLVQQCARGSEGDDEEFDPSITGAHVKRIGACAYAALSNSPDWNVVAAAARLLLALCSLPGASAYGVSNTNVLYAIGSSLLKIVLFEVKSPPQLLAAPSAKTTLFPRRQQQQRAEEEETEAVAGLRRSTRARRTQQQETNEEEEDEEEKGEEEEESDGDADDDDDDDDGEKMFATTKTKTKVSEGKGKKSPRVSPSSLKVLVVEIGMQLDHFWMRSEDNLLECCAEGMSGAVFLASMRPEFGILAREATSALANLATSSERGLMLVYKALMPALCITGRDMRLPDVSMQKQRAQCHRAAVQVMVSIAAKSQELASAWKEEAAAAATVSPSDESTPPSSPAAVQVAPVEEPEPEQPARAGRPRRGRKNAGAQPAPPTPPPAPKLTQQTPTSQLQQQQQPHALSLPVPYACVIGTMQRMAVTVPDRAHPRASVLSSLTTLLQVLAEDEGQGRAAADHFMLFLNKLSRSSKTSHRAFSLDIAVSVMGCEWLWSSSSSSPSPSAPSSSSLSPLPKVGPATLVDMLIGRCKDIASTVRVRAIGALADLLDAPPRDVTDMLLNKTARIGLLVVLRDRASDEKPLVRAKALQALGGCLCMSWPQEEQEGRGGDNTQLPLTDEDISVFILGCGDSSLAARKQALTSLSALVKARPAHKQLQQAWVVAALPLASDPESTVQVKVAACVHELLIQGSLLWVDSHKKQTVLDESKRQACALAWGLLELIAKAGSAHSKLLRSAVNVMLQQGLLTSKTCSGGSSLKHVLAAMRVACCADVDCPSVPAAAKVSRGAWVLLEAIMGQEVPGQERAAAAALSCESGAADFVVRCFLARVADLQQHASSVDAIRMLRVLEKVASGVSPGDAKLVAKRLQQLLQSLQIDNGLASAAIAVRFALSKAFASASTTNTSSQQVEDAAYADVAHWAGELLCTIHSVLFVGVWGALPSDSQNLFAGGLIKPALSPAVQAAALARCAAPSLGLGDSVLRQALASASFLLGELTMLGFSVEEDDVSRSKQVFDDGTEPQYSVSVVSRAFRLCVPQPLVLLVQLLMDVRLPDPNSLATSSSSSSTASAPAAGKGARCPESLRANAFVTMGKLCLRDRMRARDFINVFLRELHQGATNSAAIRSNALLVLGDLCVRYTSLVDRHIGAMAACLQDPEVLVRRHALVLLAQLLLQDYLKWRGLLLFRFLAAAADTDPGTAELAKAVLKNTVLVKHPEFFCQHFTEAVVIFNHCVEHPSYASAATYGSEGTSTQQVTMDGVNLAGSEREQRARRMRLFEIMLETFSEEQRIQVTAKLVQDVLAYAVDHVQLARGAAAAAASASSFENALEDTFLVLQSPLLRVGRRACDDNGAAASAAGADGEDCEEEEATTVSEAKGKGGGKNKPNSLAGAKTKVLKTLSKQHLISHTLPVVSSLKHALEAARSPLQGPLMDLLVALVKANRSEVNEVFENDPTLRIEVEYDIKMHDRAKERAAAELEAAASAAAAEQVVQAQAQAQQSPVKGEQQVAVLGLRSVTKPALKKSLLDGPESASRTSREAIMQSAKKSQDSKAAAEELGGDFADRLLGGGCGGDAVDAELPKLNRRRNWTAVTVGLMTDENANISANILSAPRPTGPTPVKKRGKKPTSPRPATQPTRTSSRRALK